MSAPMTADDLRKLASFVGEHMEAAHPLGRDMLAHIYETPLLANARTTDVMLALATMLVSTQKTLGLDDESPRAVVAILQHGHATGTEMRAAHDRAAAGGAVN